MATPQAQLATRMADQFGLKVVQFRYSNALLFGDEGVMKLFIPRSKRVLLGTPRDRMIIGDLTFLRKGDLKRLLPPSRKFEQPLTVFGCPIANFPWLVPFSWLSDQPIDERFVGGLRELFNALPDKEDAWLDKFGFDFFEKSTIDRVRPIVDCLRKLNPQSDKCEG